jgi:hypothetical protein
MYWTGKDPWTGEACFVEKTAAGRDRQKQVLAIAERKTGSPRRAVPPGLKKTRG